MRSRPRHVWLFCALLLPLLAAHARLQDQSLDDELLAATASGDVEAVTALLGQGANVNAEFGRRRGSHRSMWQRTARRSRW